ncbi:MAG TPA: FtsX-like permease family protein [Thermoanaerobaculia bacterium]|nr:FtsX-like permease family protein [Thermoanaerobaculia bacterium]
MSLRFLLRQLARELRGVAHRLVAFVLCLAVGVAAVVIVAGISSSLDRGIRLEARNLLAADLAVESSRSPSDEILAAIDALPGSRRAGIRELVTIVAAPRPAPHPDSLAPRPDDPPRTLLVELKVVDGPYPFYGDLELDPPSALAPLLGDDGVVVAPDLLARLGVAVGDEISVGGEPFTIRGLVLVEPDRLGGAFTLGPRVFLGAAGLDRTPLVDLGSRVEHSVLVQLPIETPLETLRAHAEDLAEIAPRADGYRVETYDQAQPALRRGLERLERFLGLVALLSLLVGGVGVGQAIRVWIAGRSDAIAILKCLGLRPRETFLLYLGQAAALGLLGSLAGCALGLAISAALPFFLRDIVPAELLDPWQPMALLRGIALGLGTTVVFAVPPLTQVLRVPPARVLRQNAEPLPGTRAVTIACALLLVLGTAALAGAQAGEALLAAQFTAGLAGTALALAVAAWVLVRAARRLPRGAGGRVWLRHGIASLARPGAATLAAIVAIGLGLLVVFATQQVQSQLRARMEAEIPDDAPSAFFADVQPDQWEPLAELLERQDASAVVSVPVVVARVRAIDGESVAELVEGAGGPGGRRWALTREQRLTYMEKLPEGNRIVASSAPRAPASPPAAGPSLGDPDPASGDSAGSVAGELWTDPERNELSVDEDFARDLGVRLGSTIDFDIQGVAMSFVVTSLRAVDWESFGLNFFIVAEPGALEAAPQIRIATAKLPEGSEQRIQDLVVSEFPNVTVVLVKDVLERIVALLRQVGWGISFLGAFTLVAGLVILAATVGVESSRRGREVALLKTLGMRRADVVALFATEYALLGLVAGIVGAIGGGVVSWIALTRGMDLQWRLEPAAFAIAVATAVALSVVAGAGASAGALRRRPAEVLRSE